MLGNLRVPTNVFKAMVIETSVEEVQVLGRDLVDKVRELIHEGNVQRILVKDEHGNRFHWEGTPPPKYDNVMTWWVQPKEGGVALSRRCTSIGRRTRTKGTRGSGSTAFWSWTRS
jgi:hypothetical protein